MKSITSKWPAVIISGDKITEEQAADVMISTGFDWINIYDYDADSYSSNYHDNLIKLSDELSKNEMFKYEGINEHCGHILFPNYIQSKLSLHLRGLSLNSLYNSINRDYWCTADGSIFSIKSIGSWPSNVDIIQDAKLIARTFPYLHINISVYDYHSESYNESVYIELFNIEIKNGKASFKEFNIDVHNNLLAKHFHESDSKGQYYTSRGRLNFNDIVSKKVENALIYELINISMRNDELRDIILQYKWW